MYNFNDCDVFIGVNVVNDKVEFGFFFGGFVIGSWVGGYYYVVRRSGGVDVEYFFDLSDEFGCFKELCVRE